MSTTRYSNFDDLPDVLLVKDLQNFLRIGRGSAYRLLNSGQIGSVRIGRNFKIPKTEVARFLTVGTGQID